MRDGFRSRVVLLSLGVAFGTAFIPACKRNREVESAKAAASKSLDDLKAEVAKVQKATADVRARFNALPEDLPGLETVRSKLLTIEEVMGVENARVQWLTGELNTALASRNKEQIQKLSGTIRGAIEGSKGMGKSVLELAHQLLPFERTVARFRALVASGEIFTRVLPGGYEINAANDGIEKQVIDFIEDGKKKVDKKTWFAFDRLSFSGVGAQVDFEQSREQLVNMAAMLAAYPRVKLEIGGFTDATLPAATSKKVSAAGAESVKQMLVGLGVAASRLAAEGYGPTHPVCAANDTEECKAKNRRVAVRVTAK